MAEQQYRVYEDLVGSNRQDEREDRDFAHGQMFCLPDWVKWWTARDAWGKADKKDDAKEHTVDVRVCGFVMDGADSWPKGMRDRTGGLVYTFPFTHHRDANRDRHLCLKPFGKGGKGDYLPGATVCPRCEAFEDMRESTRDMEQKAAWEKIKVFSQKFSGLIFGYVDGDVKNLRAFEFSDTKPGKKFDKDPTFFERIVGLCTDKSIPAASRVDSLFYSYGPRAQILRLKFKWVVPNARMPYWQLTDIFKVGREDGAPSTDVDASVAERIKPWEWLDVKGEQERMLASDGSADAKADKGADLDAMDYAALMAFAMEKQMTSILEEGFEADETVALRAAIKKETK